MIYSECENIDPECHMQSKWDCLDCNTSFCDVHQHGRHNQKPRMKHNDRFRLKPGSKVHAVYTITGDLHSTPDKAVPYCNRSKLYDLEDLIPVVDYDYNDRCKRCEP